MRLTCYYAQLNLLIMSKKHQCIEKNEQTETDSNRMISVGK